MRVTAIIRFEHEDGSLEFMEMRVHNWEQHRKLEPLRYGQTIVDLIPGPTIIKLEGVLS